MNDDFKKFRSKIIAHAVIESVIAGLSAGLIVVAALLLPLTLTGITVNAGIYVGAGLGMFVIVGGLTFVLIRPTEKRIARRVDTELAMHEKVQTLVAFSSSNEPMAVIQRDDANSRLAAAGTKKIKFKRAWQCSVASVVAVGLFAGAVTVAALGGKSEDTQAVGNYTYTRLRNLVGTVQNSSLDEVPKAIVLEQLNLVIESVYDVEKQEGIPLTYDERVTIVSQAVVNIDAAIDTVVTGEPIGNSMYELCVDATLSELGIHIRALSGGTAYSTMAAWNIVLDDDNFNSYDSAAVAKAISEYSAQMIVALSSSSVSADDALYTILAGLASELGDAANTPAAADGASDAKAAILSAARDAVGKYAPPLRLELQAQSADRQLDWTIYNELQEIFEIADEDMPDIGEVYEDTVPGQEGDDGKEDEDDPSGGGAGRGDALYGSDSLIYDYTTGEQVQYGEVFDRYNSIIVSLINDGRIDEKYIEMINAYLNALAQAREEEEQ